MAELTSLRQFIPEPTTSLTNVQDLSGFTQQNPLPVDEKDRQEAIREISRRGITAQAPKPPSQSVMPAPNQQTSLRGLIDSLDFRQNTGPDVAAANRAMSQQPYPLTGMRQEMIPATPTLRERAYSGIVGALGGGSDPTVRRRADMFTSALDVVPGFATPADLSDARQMIGEGRMVSGVFTGGMGMMGAIPGVAAANKALKPMGRKLLYPDESISRLDFSNPVLMSAERQQQIKKSPEFSKGLERFPSEDVQRQSAELNEALYQGQITPEQFRDRMSNLSPIRPIQGVPELDTYENIVASIPAAFTKKGIVGLFDDVVKAGQRVASRLDINAYRLHNKWVVALHGPGSGGKSIGYGKSAVLDNVDFTSSPDFFMRVGRQDKAKGPLARMEGNWVDVSPEEARKMAVKADQSDNWIEVGFNPDRASYFYDKATGQPLASARRVIQIGPKVLATKPVYRELRDPAHAVTTASGGTTYRSVAGPAVIGAGVMATQEENE